MTKFDIPENLKNGRSCLVKINLNVEVKAYSFTMPYNHGYRSKCKITVYVVIEYAISSII